MTYFWGRFFANVIGLFAVDALFSGVQIEGAAATLIAALILGFVNANIRPVVHLLALPLSIVTFGVFALVVNGLCLGLVALVTPGFQVHGCGTAVFAAIMLSLISAIAGRMIGVQEDE